MYLARLSFIPHGSKEQVLVLLKSELNRLNCWIFEELKVMVGSRAAEGGKNLWQWCLCWVDRLQLSTESPLKHNTEFLSIAGPHHPVPAPVPFQLSNWAAALLSLSYLWMLFHIWEIRLSHLNLIWISVWRINLRHQRESKKCTTQ